MELEAWISSQEQFITCSLCLKIYSEPKSLPCQHSYCSECIEILLQDKDQCPLCRKRFPESMTAKDLPDNLLLHAAIEAFNTARKLSQQPQQTELALCDVCEDSPAILVCQECGERLCEFDTQHHKKAKKTAAHILLPLDNAPEVLRNRQRSRCSLHSAEELNLYCEDCDKPICYKCAFSSKHRGHGTSLIDEIAEDKKTEALQVAAKLKEPTSAMEDALKMVKGRQEEVRAAAADTRKAVDEYFNNLDKLLKQRQAEMQKKLDEQVRDILKSLAAQEAEQESMRSLLLNSASQLEQMAAQNDIIGLLRHKVTMLDLAAKLEYMQKHLEPYGLADTAFVAPELSQTEKFMQSLGEIKGDGFLNIVKNRRQEENEDEEEDEKDREGFVELDLDDLDSYDIFKLKQYCKQEGITVLGKGKKAFIKAIEEYNEDGRDDDDEEEEVKKKKTGSKKSDSASSEKLVRSAPPPIQGDKRQSVSSSRSQKENEYKSHNNNKPASTQLKMEVKHEKRK